MKPKPFNVRLLALIASKMPWLSGDQFPREMKLLDFGVNPTRKGPVRLGQNTRAHFSTMQRERGFDRVALDFEHNTVPGTKAYKESSEPRPVAAYGVPELRGDGLYLTQIEPTPEGKKSGRNFIDLSPAPEFDDNDEVIFLHSVALCRQGAVDDLTLDKAACYTVELPANAGQTQNEDALMEKVLAALRKGLGLAETATEEDIGKCLSTLNAGMAQGAKSMEQITALNVKLAEIEKSIATLSVAGAPGKGAEEIAAKIVTLTAKVEDASTKIATFAAEIEKRDRSDLVALACREGKVLPLNADQVAATPVATLRDLVKNLAVTVPVEKRTPLHVQEFSVTAEAELTEAQKQIARNCGVDPEKLKKK
jgi:phage I-like protein